MHIRKAHLCKCKTKNMCQIRSLRNTCTFKERSHLPKTMYLRSIHRVCKIKTRNINTETCTSVRHTCASARPRTCVKYVACEIRGTFKERSHLPKTMYLRSIHCVCTCSERKHTPSHPTHPPQCQDTSKRREHVKKLLNRLFPIP